MTRSRIAQVVAISGLAIILTFAAALLPSAMSDTDNDQTLAAPGADTISAAYLPAADLAGQIEQLRTRLDAQPSDARSWAVLSLLLIEEGRVTLDPATYLAADEAATRSLAVAPNDNDLGLAARAALLSAQHRFEQARRVANQALAINPYSAAALGVRVDALTELGQLQEALRAARRFDAVQPSLAASTRLAYQAELRGDDREATRLFTTALRDSNEPSALAFVQYHLGELERRAGRLQAADGHYAAALDALPSDARALAGSARIAALRGDTQQAIETLQEVVAQQPLPEHLIELGELYELMGQSALAQQQYDVVRATSNLARSAGIRPDLELAWFEADHGDPSAALAVARSEWQRRRSPLVADALAWALHVNGRSTAALEYARIATSYGGDARSMAHRGLIEAELELQGSALEHLATARQLDRGMSAWLADHVDTAVNGLRAKR